MSIEAHDIALIQYTSGSSGAPKGVVLTHAHLLANIRAIGQLLRPNSQDTCISWRPLYHDMGLIGMWLGSLYFGACLVVMSPLQFLSRPERWLWAIHKLRGTLSTAPNFAHELCFKNIRDEYIQGLDLSSLRAALNGAEPVSPLTLAGFAQRYKAYGLHDHVLLPVYELAEAPVALTFPPLGRGWKVDVIQREIFLKTGRAVPARPEDAHPLSLVGCGLSPARL